jgi:membrane protease YdiL (CAAX protease family)
MTTVATQVGVTVYEDITSREPSPSRSAHRQAAIALLTISIVLSVDHYRNILPVPVLDDVLLYLIVPLLMIMLILRRSPLDFGLCPGRWREGLAWAVGGALLMVGVAWVFAQLPEFRPYYADYFALRNPGGNVWASIGLSGLQMFAWEFLFRGFLLFALADLLGPYAIWVQMVPFAVAHFGKPEWETYASIPGGLLSGWIAYRVGSFFPSWLIHWALAVVMSIWLGGA